MRRTPLKRSTPLTRAKPLPRKAMELSSKRLPKMSERRKAFEAEMNALRGRLSERCGSLCERCGESPATDIHHRLRRSQGGDNSLDNLAYLDRGCHRFLHDHPTLAFETGWLVHGS
jgi:5-methylcytosine-specific restriction endonuclease McrA